MKKLPKFVSRKEAVKLFSQLGEEFTIVRNPSDVFPDHEFYPLAPKADKPLKELAGIVKDMDGTTTTTEPLCLHSLEYMVGRITGKIAIDGARGAWAGLDKAADYPHIIGNSTTKHVEYLVTKYGKGIDREAFLKAYIAAALWTLAVGKDEGRRREVASNIVNLGLAPMLADEKFRQASGAGRFDIRTSGPLVAELYIKYSAGFKTPGLTEKVRAAVDVYYQRYHEILSAIDSGAGEKLSSELLGKGRRLIEPMPGVGIFLALAKGWLGADLELFYDGMAKHLAAHPKLKYKAADLLKFKSRLAPLGRYFEKHPVKAAVVTSSIYYEANIVMTEVFGILRKEIAGWPVAAEKKAFLLDRFSHYSKVYDGFITASDSNEIRLKPHRDLYSIALHQMGIPREKFCCVAGFEDSESGTIAIRAAGVGLCAAVPFADTFGHNLDAASHLLFGGLPETILVENMFLGPKAVK